MKWKLDRKYTTIAVYALLVIAFALVFGTIFLNLDAISRLFGLIWEKSLSVLFGVFFTFCLLPAVKFFEHILAKPINRKKPHPTLVSLLAAILVDIIFIGILVVAVVGIIPALLDAIETFRHEVAPEILAFGVQLEADGSVFAHLYREIYDAISGIFSQDTGSLISSVATFAKNFFSRAYAIGVGLVLATYFLVCRRYLTGIARKLSTALFPEKFRRATLAVVKRIYYFFVEFFSYRLISGVSMALVVFLLFLPFRIDYGIIVATVLFVANFIPVFGPIVATLGCTALIAVFSPLWKAVVACVILSSIEILISLFIEPFCLRKKLRPGPGVVVTSVIVSYALFGFGGVIFAVPLYSSIDVAYREIQTRLLVRKGLPTSNAYYLALEELPVPATDREDTPADEPRPTPDAEPLGTDEGAASFGTEDAVGDEAVPAVEITAAHSYDDGYITDHYALAEQTDIGLGTDDAHMPIPDAIQPLDDAHAATPATSVAPAALPKPDAPVPPSVKKTRLLSRLFKKKP